MGGPRHRDRSSRAGIRRGEPGHGDPHRRGVQAPRRIRLLRGTATVRSTSSPSRTRPSTPARSRSRVCCGRVQTPRTSSSPSCGFRDRAPAAPCSARASRAAANSSDTFALVTGGWDNSANGQLTVSYNVNASSPDTGDHHAGQPQPGHARWPLQHRWVVCDRPADQQVLPAGRRRRGLHQRLRRGIAPFFSRLTRPESSSISAC